MVNIVKIYTFLYNFYGEFIMSDYIYKFDDYVKIGLTIKKLRIQSGISQTKLAEGICDRTTIIHLEKGRSKQPSIYLLNQLCKRLCITLDDFFLLAYGGIANQLLLKRNEIDALLKIRDYEKAYSIAKRFYNSSSHPVDQQYFGLIEGCYFYSIKEYTKAKNTYLKALNITSSVIKDEVYTLTEIRLINGIIYCNWRLDNKLSTDETLNYIKILNNSIYNYPIDKDYRLIISLMICTIQFYFTLNMHKDTMIIINNAIEISHKYCCYDHLGNLWAVLANCYSILKDTDKAKEYFEKSNTFFKLFKENEIYNQSIKYQQEFFENMST